MSNPTTIEEYGEKLASIIHDNDLSYRDASRLSGLTSRAIRNIINGDTKTIKAETEEILQKFFNNSSLWKTSISSKEMAKKIEDDLNIIILNANLKVTEEGEYIYRIELVGPMGKYGLIWGIEVKNRYNDARVVRNEVLCIFQALLIKMKRSIVC